MVSYYPELSEGLDFNQPLRHLHRLYFLLIILFHIYHLLWILFSFSVCKGCCPLVHKLKLLKSSFTFNHMIVAVQLSAASTARACAQLVWFDYISVSLHPAESTFLPFHYITWSHGSSLHVRKNSSFLSLEGSSQRTFLVSRVKHIPMNFPETGERWVIWQPVGLRTESVSWGCSFSIWWFSHSIKDVFKIMILYI